MKNLKKLSKNELKKIVGAGSSIDEQAPVDNVDNGCYVNLYSCPGQGKARLSANGQNFTCC
ncbi:hypothetical protein N6B72_14880 [Chryseobacterium soli]|uniref:bacteriocin-like protein n=1 Tax=Chryseobacterium soli TaxID=445961 RepID=UPI002952F4DA|nr:hypothetical protein [Chryseobacterium soli]MDV7698209.1 hypothetical protein [Chryseobacterium soli]